MPPMTSPPTPRPKPPRSPEMSPAIWRHLPPHLLDVILARLPLKTLLGLRTTCKHFDALLHSPSFLSLTAATAAASFPAFLLLSHPQIPAATACLYDPSLSKWRAISLPRSAAAAAIVSSSAHGLVCFSSPGAFLFANLLTRSSRIVRSPFLNFTFASLIPSSSPGADGDAESYKLCLISDSPTSPATSLFVYSPISNLWTEFRSPEPFHRYNSQQEAVFSNGSLYFTTKEPFSVNRFDLSAGEWSSPTAPLPHGLTFIRVASGGGQEGKLYLVGGVGADGIARSLNVWELGEEGREWALVETLPELMARRFFAVCYHNYDHLYCVWHEGMICICCYTWPEVLVYRVRRATWRWLERCPLLPEKWSCGFRWFSYRPDLYALV